jgi:hypothetical protein
MKRPPDKIPNLRPKPQQEPESKKEIIIEDHPGDKIWIIENGIYKQIIIGPKIIFTDLTRKKH